MTDLTNTNVKNIQHEQQQELFETIRHFITIRHSIKYEAIGNTESGVPIPEHVKEIIGDLCNLHEQVFETGVTNE